MWHARFSRSGYHSEIIREELKKVVLQDDAQLHKR
jgi:hypothetical protein